MSARLLSAAKVYGKACADYSLAHDAWSARHPEDARVRYADIELAAPASYVTLVDPFLDTLHEAEKELHAAARESFDGAEHPMDLPRGVEA